MILLAAASLGGAAVACALCAWRKSSRERDVLAAVREETSRWQAELEATGVAAAADGSPAPAVTEPAAGPTAHTPRVLVVDDRREKREAIVEALGGLGVEAVFADSQWAAEAAAREAERADDPYDLILVGTGMEGVEASGPEQAESLDVTELARLLAAGGQHSYMGCVAAGAAS